MKRTLALILTVILVCTALPSEAQAASKSKKKARGVMDVPYYQTALSGDKQFMNTVNIHTIIQADGFSITIIPLMKKRESAADCS